MGVLTNIRPLRGLCFYVEAINPPGNIGNGKHCMFKTVLSDPSSVLFPIIVRFQTKIFYHDFSNRSPWNQINLF